MIKRKNIILIWIFSAIGLASAIYLTWLHQQIFTGKIEDFSFCGISRNFSCETVSASPYSEWFGVPMAWAGALLYLFWLALASAGLLNTEKHGRNATSIILFCAVMAVAVDIYLAQLMIFTIGSICLLCLLTYLLNLAIMILAIRAIDIPPVRAMTTAIRLLLPFSGQTRYGYILTFILIAAAGAFGQMQMQKSIAAASRFDEAGFRKFEKSFKRLKVDSSADPFHGAADAKLTIIEFSDFQCPHCRKAHVVLQTILPAYKDRVKLIFKNMPLGLKCNAQFRIDGKGRELHASACDLALLGEAALKQDKFWPLHDLIFSRQSEFKGAALDKAALMQLGKDAGLDVARLEKDFNDPDTAKRVAADLDDAYRLGIQGTPTLLFNGLLLGMPPPSILKKIIDLELEYASTPH